ncbi:hypothetical protein EAI_08887 [Harpegnathos saltator]|uniref:Uncharacterized protein n=1 Tax=Harpegnathos saltator TaxID=610380 RepID=E2CA65_HARSA|nr:hypothetical protein EAI_08887 [Harpegnathos saltator]
MAANSGRVAAEVTAARSEDEEQQKELYPDTVECKNFTVEDCDAKDEKMASEGREEGNHCRMEGRSDRGAQRVQTQTQLQTDMQADSDTHNVSATMMPKETVMSIRC